MRPHHGDVTALFQIPTTNKKRPLARPFLASDGEVWAEQLHAHAAHATHAAHVAAHAAAGR